MDPAVSMRASSSRCRKAHSSAVRSASVSRFPGTVVVNCDSATRLTILCGPRVRTFSGIKLVCPQSLGHAFQLCTRFFSALRLTRR